MTQTFPLLRKLAAERNVTLTELDLRWGITEDEAKNGKVVDICLREVENSIPFFIGIIGNRYGWIPKKEDIWEGTIDRYSQVDEYLKEHLSVTEMEMQFGVLQRKEKMHAYFYIKEEQAENIDYPEMLKRLKEEVIHSDYPSSYYSSKENLGAVQFFRGCPPCDNYPNIVHKRYIKKGTSATPCTCALKPLIFEFSDSAEAFECLSLK